MRSAWREALKTEYSVPSPFGSIHCLRCCNCEYASYVAKEPCFFVFFIHPLPLFFPSSPFPYCYRWICQRWTSPCLQVVGLLFKRTRQRTAVLFLFGHTWSFVPLLLSSSKLKCSACHSRSVSTPERVHSSPSQPCQRRSCHSPLLGGPPRSCLPSLSTSNSRITSAPYKVRKLSLKKKVIIFFFCRHNAFVPRLHLDAS